jgi:hypothetical protein
MMMITNSAFTTNRRSQSMPRPMAPSQASRLRRGAGGSRRGSGEGAGASL